MHTKGVIGLVAAAAVSVAAAATVAFSGGSAPTDPRLGKLVLPEVAAKPTDIAKITLRHGTTAITFASKGAAWTVAEKSSYPADREKMRKLLFGLAQITYVEPKTAAPSLYARLQVEDPGGETSRSTLVEIDDGNGAGLGKVIVGRRRIDELGGGNDGVYVRLPGDARSWLARGTLDLDSDIVQWLDRRIVDIDQKRIKQAVLAPGNNETVTIARDKPEDKFTLKQLPPNRKLKSDTVLVEPATELSGLDLVDVRGAGDLSFPKDGVASASFTTFDGLSVRVELIKEGDKDWIRLSAASEGNDKAGDEAKTLDERWKPWVYAIAAYKASPIRTKLADLLEPVQPAQSSSGSQSAPANSAAPAPAKKAK